jgi:hypothetical protein
MALNARALPSNRISLYSSMLSMDIVRLQVGDSALTAMPIHLDDLPLRVGKPRRGHCTNRDLSLIGALFSPFCIFSGTGNRFRHKGGKMDVQPILSAIFPGP